MAGPNQDEPVRLLPSDAAVLESQRPRTDLPCAVRPIKPSLGFDLKFHSGYDVTIPLQALAGNGDSLITVFRVKPEEHPGTPIYFSQQWAVPPIQDDAPGKADLHGSLVLGEGRYLVEWLLHDGAGRYCSSRWNIEVNPRGKDKQIPPRAARSAVTPETVDLFRQEPPVKRDNARPLNVVVLFHLAPNADGATALRSTETEALFSILRRIAEEPRIGRFSMIAFNLDQRSVLYKSSDLVQLDFPALGEALQQLRLGTVEIQKLRENEGETHFLTTLLAGNVARTGPDALIFVGPRMAIRASGLNSLIKEVRSPECPVFYLSYNPDPLQNPWRDLIGSIVKSWKGSEYTISKPRDLFTAWTEVMSRISRNTRRASGVPASVSVKGFVPKK
jgi:hypothetical protein